MPYRRIKWVRFFAFTISVKFAHRCKRKYDNSGRVKFVKANKFNATKLIITIFFVLFVKQSSVTYSM